FLWVSGVPALFALATVFVVVWLQWRRRMIGAGPPDPAELPAVGVHTFDRNQVIKGAAALLALLLLFLTSLPRGLGALMIAALLLGNGKITRRRMIGTVDWPLLLLVACLFAVTGTLNQAGIASKLLAFLDHHDLLPNGLVPLTIFSVVTSNAIGSLPAAM